MEKANLRDYHNDELLRFYNNLSGKVLKKLESKEDGIERIEEILSEKQMTAVEEEGLLKALSITDFEAFTKPAPAPQKSDSKAPAQSASTSALNRTAPHEKVAVIRMLDKGKKNPKMTGTMSHARYEFYKDGITVEDFLKAGGRRDDLRNDVKKGYIAIISPAVKAAETEAVDQVADEVEGENGSE